MAQTESHFPGGSKKRVNRAGAAVRDGIASDEDLRVIDEWRAAHRGVLNTFQAILRNRTRDTGIAVAQRHKRKRTIFDKLLRFARWRRMEIGTHHKMNARTLHLFFADCAWREAERETIPVDKFAKALLTVAREGVCRRFKKYGRGMKERETKPRTISLRPIHRAAGAALEGALKVMDQASRFSDSVTKFLKLTKPTPSFAPAGYAQVAEAPLWTLGRRRKPVSTGTPPVLPPVTGYKLPPAYTPVYSFNVFGMLAQALRA